MYSSFTLNSAPHLTRPPGFSEISIFHDLTRPPDRKSLLRGDFFSMIFWLEIVNKLTIVIKIHYSDHFHVAPVKNTNKHKFTRSWTKNVLCAERAEKNTHLTPRNFPKYNHDFSHFTQNFSKSWFFTLNSAPTQNFSKSWFFTLNSATHLTRPLRGKTNVHT